MRQLTILISLLALLHAPTALAQAWSLEQCISHAVEHNLQVKQSQVATQSSKLDNTQAKLNYLPSLSGSVGYNASFGRSLDPTTYQFVSGSTVNNVNAGLALNTQLFAGMQKLHSLRRSELNLLASVQETERIKNEITIAVAAAYLQVLYNKEQVSVSENQIATLREQIARTSILVEAGSLPLGSRLELESQLANEQYNLVNYRNQGVNAILNLTQLLELRDAPNFDIEVPSLERQQLLMQHLMSDSSATDIERVYQKATDLPQIEVEKLRQRIAQRDVSIARARYYPSISLGANYGSSFSDARQRPQLSPDGTIFYGKYPFLDQLADNASSGVQISMSVPIFNALSTRNNVRRSKLGMQTASISLSQAENRLYKEIQQAITDANGAIERFRSASVGVRSNEESFRYAEQKFNAGAATAVDFNIAKNNLITAQSMMIQAKYEYIFKLKIIDFYQGIPITL